MHNPNQPRQDLSPPRAGANFTLPVKSLLVFLALFLLFFIILLALWSPLANAYGWLFRTTGNVLVGEDSRSRVWFERPEDADDRHDTQIAVVEPKERVKRATKISSRRHGYMPTIFLLALTMATPVAWPRRLRYALWGLLWVNLYVAIKLALIPTAYGSVDPSGSWTVAGILRRLFWVVGASSVGWMLVPLLIWAILTFRVLFRSRTATLH